MSHTPRRIVAQRFTRRPLCRTGRYTLNRFGLLIVVSIRRTHLCLASLRRRPAASRRMLIVMHDSTQLSTQNSPWVMPARSMISLATCSLLAAEELR